MFRLIKSVRDRVALSLTAFPPGWRFIVTTLLAIGFGFSSAFLVALFGFASLSQVAMLGSMFVSCFVFDTAITRSYQFDATMKIKKNEHK